MHENVSIRNKDALNSPFDVVAITDGTEPRAITLAVCRKLKQRFSSKIYAYVRSNDTRRYYEPFMREGVIDDIIYANILHDTALAPVIDETAIFSKAREHEKRLGCSYNSVRMTRRDFGHGFYLGGFNHPTSYFAVKPSYPQIVNAYNQIFDFWKGEYDSKNITLHLNGLKEEAMTAHAREIPFRYLYAARVENHFFWATSEMIDYRGVAEAYRKLENERFEPIEAVDQYFADVAQRRRIVEARPLRRLLKRILGTTLGYMYRFKHRDQFAPSYFYSSMISYLVREYREMKKLRAPRATKLSDLKGRRFVYFPLHTEPEMSLHWMSPEYFSQLWAIASLARDLPADTILVVKETIYGVGRRPRDFYEQILRLRNTVLLDVFELGVDVVRAADVIVTMAGSAGLEAALIGKPVILFGRHNYYDCVPHVRVVTRDEDLKPTIDWALSEEFDSDMAREDGARLREAALRASFDLGKYSNLALDAFTDADVERATDALVLGVLEQSKAKGRVTGA